jgi:T-complex protein 1 subunit gamma
MDDVGTRAELFDIRKIGDEYYTFVTAPSADTVHAPPTKGAVVSHKGAACTILIRGGSKDIMNEVERNLHDAMCVVRNVLLDTRMMPGGGASEMALARALQEKSKQVCACATSASTRVSGDRDASLAVRGYCTRA